MRPPSIIWFVRLYGAAILIGFVTALLMVGEINREEGFTGWQAALAYGASVAGTAIPVALLWLVATRGSDPARWVLVVLAGFSVVTMILALVRGNYVLNLFGWLGLAHRALTVAASALTFRRDARAWLLRARAEA